MVPQQSCQRYQLCSFGKKNHSSRQEVEACSNLKNVPLSTASAFDDGAKKKKLLPTLLKIKNKLCVEEVGEGFFNLDGKMFALSSGFYDKPGKKLS